MDRKFPSYSYSWTQPYGVSYNPFYQSVQDAELERELDRLDAVDVLVDEMLTYPEAEAILNKIRQQGTGNV
jgi:hypothetical protein